MFLHLRRRTNRIYYGKTASGKEIDFVTAAPGFEPTQGTSVQLWQVCYEMEGIGPFEWETRALFEAMQQYQLTTSTIITYNIERRLSQEGMQIEVVPAWKFLLS